MSIAHTTPYLTFFYHLIWLLNFCVKNSSSLSHDLRWFEVLGKLGTNRHLTILTLSGAVPKFSTAPSLMIANLLSQQHSYCWLHAQPIRISAGDYLIRSPTPGRQSLPANESDLYLLNACEHHTMFCARIDIKSMDGSREVDAIVQRSIKRTAQWRSPQWRPLTSFLLSPSCTTIKVCT